MPHKPKSPARKPRKGRGTARRGKKPSTMAVEVPNLPAYRGPGRPSELTREMLEAICSALAEGASQKEAALSCYINPGTFYEWRARGAEDVAAGTPTLYAEFADRVPAERARGRVALRNKVHRAIRSAIPDGTAQVDPRVANAAIQAGRLAQQVIEAQESGRRGALKRWGNKEHSPSEQLPAAATASAEPPVDLSRLEAQEVAALRWLLRKGRGQEPNPAPPAVAQVIAAAPPG